LFVFGDFFFRESVAKRHQEQTVGANGSFYHVRNVIAEWFAVFVQIVVEVLHFLATQVLMLSQIEISS